jgi:hypothetical protein
MTTVTQAKGCPVRDKMLVENISNQMRVVPLPEKDDKNK